MSGTRSTGWNYGDILDAVDATVDPSRIALIHADHVVRWRDFTRRTNNLARALLERGVRSRDKIAFYMRNRAEYSEGIAAAFKARLTHVNVNYRYVDHELVYLLDNADAAVVLYTAEFAGRVAAIRAQLPKVLLWVEVADGHAGADDVVEYETLAGAGGGAPLGIERSGDDMLFLYTGGTTGMPKGVMWRHDDLWRGTGAGGNPRIGVPPSPDLATYIERLRVEPPPVNLPLPPMMHGTGLLSAVSAMTHGGTCVTLPARSFDADEALAAIERHGVTAATIVGDAFARPLVEALDGAKVKRDISSLRFISSSGVMWTREIKAGLLRHNPALTLVDGFASSEALGLGSSVMTRDQAVDVARFSLGPTCRVFTEDHREVRPGSGEAGMVAVSGPLPVGYYKDEAKTAQTFPVIGGVRYSIPGDWVRVEADGTLTLLGRGSNCINTAGEKVYPEEVEEALKAHASVADALVVGIADAKWGQAITAVVQLEPGAELDEVELKDFVRTRIAAYKVPKRILAKDDLARAPNGKADYKHIREFAEAFAEARVATDQTR
ncbi:MAG TPA: acyl-CoA synthetase [Pseudomonadales bacterium]|nr:acyl-CoA synthetase [Pseudomonadales bacterium]